MIAAKAIAFYEALQPSFKEYQHHIINNAQALANALQKKGYRIVTGGTDNHLAVIDLRTKNINGRAAENALNKAGITVSRSCIPFDPEKPWITSGIRLGTAAVTTRGMHAHEMKMIAEFIDEVIMHHTDDLSLNMIRTKVEHLCARFPIYASLPIPPLTHDQSQKRVANR